jgi:DNA-binding CsgD family transcriptional regulator
MPKVLLLCSNKPSLQFTLAENQSVLGRGPDCDFIVQDTTVSRRHALLYREEDSFLITDLESRNGTRINDRRVKSCSVAGGEVVRFGGVSFVATVTDLDPEALALSEDTASCSSEAGVPQVPSASTCELLTFGQRRVFEMLLTGQPEKIVARQLRLSPHTVHNHVRAIFRVCEVHSRTELLAKYVLENTAKKPSQQGRPAT